MTGCDFGKSCLVLGWVLAAVLYPGVLVHAGEMQVGRYSVWRILPTPGQLDPLVEPITMRFPEHVRTVGEAMRHLLQDSGYRLADHATASSGTMQNLVLPGVHRELGPVTLRQALETLAGPAFRLVQDPVHRLVAFESCARLKQPVDGKHATVPARDPENGN